jgi:hypothetical protein
VQAVKKPSGGPGALIRAISTSLTVAILLASQATSHALSAVPKVASTGTLTGSETDAAAKTATPRGVDGVSTGTRKASTSAVKVSAPVARTAFLAAVRASSRFTGPQQVAIVSTGTNGAAIKVDLVTDSYGNLRFSRQGEALTQPNEEHLVAGVAYLRPYLLPETLSSAAEQIDALDGERTAWYSQAATNEHRFERKFLAVLDDIGAVRGLSAASTAKRSVKGGTTTWTLLGQGATLTATVVGNRITSIRNVTIEGLVDVKITKGSSVKLTAPIGRITAMTRVSAHAAERTGEENAPDEVVALSGSALRALVERIVRSAATTAQQRGNSVAIDDVADALERLEDEAVLTAHFVSIDPLRVEFADPNDALQRVCVDFSTSVVSRGSCA